MHQPLLFGRDVVVRCHVAFQRGIICQAVMWILLYVKHVTGTNDILYVVAIMYMYYYVHIAAITLCMYTHVAAMSVCIIMYVHTCSCYVCMYCNVCIVCSCFIYVLVSSLHVYPCHRSMPH